MRITIPYKDSELFQGLPDMCVHYCRGDDLHRHVYVTAYTKDAAWYLTQYLAEQKKGRKACGS